MTEVAPGSCAGFSWPSSFTLPAGAQVHRHSWCCWLPSFAVLSSNYYFCNSTNSAFTLGQPSLGHADHCNSMLCSQNLLSQPCFRQHRGKTPKVSTHMMQPGYHKRKMYPETITWCLVIVCALNYNMEYLQLCSHLQFPIFLVGAVNQQGSEKGAKDKPANSVGLLSNQHLPVLNS